jgi:hypothetical protein
VAPLRGGGGGGALGREGERERRVELYSST